MLPHGVEDRYLRISKVPSHQELQEMRCTKLVVLSSPSQPLSIDTCWTNEEVNVEIKRLFPQATEFLRHEHSGERQLWLGATSHKNVVTLAGNPFPTGVELADYCKVLGRPSADRILYIASKHKIAKRHWDWAPPESEDLGSEVDTVPSEDIVFTLPKPRPAYKGKRKAKEVKVKAEPELETVPKALEEEEPDMRQAAKLRTLLDTGVLKRTTLFIPGSSDEPEPDVLDQDVVVVSDDENEELPPLLPWKTQSPSPAPSLAPLSPNHDLPSFFADFTHSLSPPPMETVTATSSASSSVSGPSTSSSVFSGTFSTWTPALAPSTATPASAPLPAWLIPDGGSEIMNVPNPPPDVQATDASGHRFKRMGKGRG
ncbi:hypothetical protein K438DRAFT_1796199 [Mycena galopus ATCC 62051]|nr:hypothetical protein K438DRAFT_1796199 [Mycena galopus ATCC 62051]